jgi:hypothetical protein
LESVTEKLQELVHLSTSIAKLQTLFKSFIELCEGLVTANRRKTCALDTTADIDDLLGQHTPFTTDRPPTVEHPALVTTSDSFSSLQSTSSQFAVPDNTFTFSTESIPGIIEPAWGLFDVQPTLDWLDADFSFFDNEQYQF